MPRSARKISKSGIYHIMLRGINRQTIFHDEQDTVRFLGTLAKYIGVCKGQVYAYCIMGNHVHLLLKETEEPISDMVKRISASYVFWYNKKYERCGHLFQERFKSEVVDNDEYFLTVIRYIHQNPIKAGISAKIDNYKWSSYGEYIGECKIINTDLALQMLSADRKQAVIKFKEFHEKTNNDSCLEFEDKIQISDQEIRKYICESGIENIEDIKLLQTEARKNVLRGLKSIEGASLRQLSRITGIPKSVIDRA